MKNARSKVLITGGSGLLAVNWAQSIRNDCAVVLGLHKKFIKLAGAESIWLGSDSVKDLISQFSAAEVDTVIHAAGLTSVDICEASPDLANKLNVNLAENVAQAANTLGLKLVHISTDHLFSGCNSFSSEEVLPEPLNVYGKTKAEAEMRVIRACPSALVIRTNFYGWGTTYRHSFSDFVIRSLRAKESITLFDNLYFTPIIIDDLVRTTHELIRSGARGVFNIVGNDRVSKKVFGELLADKFCLDKSLIHSIAFSDRDDLVVRPLDMSLSNLKITEFLNKSPDGLIGHIDLLFNQEQNGLASELLNL
jgi:dTDP-4-dehydrorhamnose reductase